MNEVTGSIAKLITAMSWDDDPNFKETAIRYGNWLYNYQGLTKQACIDKSKEDLSKRFPTNNHNMVIVGPTKVFSLCPHHLLPIEYDVWVGYIPNKEVVGLSKLARVPQNFARYPFLQEDFTENIAHWIFHILNAKGVMVIVEGIHNCMRMRGVKQPDAVTKTSALRGVFASPPEGLNPRQEMLELIKLG